MMMSWKNSIKTLDVIHKVLPITTMPEILSNPISRQDKLDGLCNITANGGSDQDEASLAHLGAEIHARVGAFLAVNANDDEALRQVQVQTRKSLDVIRQALDRYSYGRVSPLYLSPSLSLSLSPSPSRSFSLYIRLSSQEMEEYIVMLIISLFGGRRHRRGEKTIDLKNSHYRIMAAKIV